MFGMGTGDPSQYGHRQNEAFSGREALAPGAPSQVPERYAQGLQLAFDLGMALGGWLSAACRGVYRSSGSFSRTSIRNADCNLAPETLLSFRN